MEESKTMMNKWDCECKQGHYNRTTPHSNSKNRQAYGIIDHTDGTIRKSDGQIEQTYSTIVHNDDEKN